MIFSTYCIFISYIYITYYHTYHILYYIPHIIYITYIHSNNIYICNGYDIYYIYNIIFININIGEINDIYRR